MSHVTSINDIVIKEEDLKVLPAVCEELGLTLNQGQSSYKWYGRWVNDYSAQDAAHLNGITPDMYGKCEHALSVPNNPTAYEVGVTKIADGTYRFAFDFWSGGHGLCKHIGAKGEKLYQTFNKHKALANAQKAGLKVKNIENSSTGKIKITLGPKFSTPFGGK